ncbi:amidohydrolase family protein [Patescibacteria group bacterium]|nr:amidohydrolase family protein [Patescibacteria group bacterium]
MISIEGNIVNKKEMKRQRVEVDEVSGLITKVSEATGEADHVFKDELIFPGFIDLHVHAREDASHTQDYKEDFLTASFAAINGGVVAFAEMPNNPIPPIDDTTYKVKKELTAKSKVPILLYAAVDAESKPLSMKVPYKVFMGQSIGHLFFTSRDTLENTLENYRGQNISFHCEDPKILDANKDAPTHESKRPKEAEISAVDVALELIQKYNLTGKICHCSTVEGINKIVEAKKLGVKVTVEVTPHHLFFDETMFTPENHGLFQVNPPIRQTKENRLGMIKALKNGDIDYLATDHAPHTIEEKQKGISGLTHLDTYGPFTTWLMKEHGFTTEEISRVCSERPAKFVGDFWQEKYGEIKSKEI